MNDELLNERVKAVAFFNAGTNPCRLLKFQRPNGQEIAIKEIGLVHPTVYGKRMVHVYDVTDGRADYRLEFDAESLTWKLLYIRDEYGA